MLVLKRFGDPSIPLDRRVLSSVGLGGRGGASKKSHAILTGPNRGGKSSFLRGVLMNVVVAHCFGAAFATKAQMTPFTWIADGMRLDDTPGKQSMFEREVAFGSAVLAKEGGRGAPALRMGAAAVAAVAAAEPAPQAPVPPPPRAGTGGGGTAARAAAEPPPPSQARVGGAAMASSTFFPPRAAKRCAASDQLAVAGRMGTGAAAGRQRRLRFQCGFQPSSPGCCQGQQWGVSRRPVLGHVRSCDQHSELTYMVVGLAPPVLLSPSHE